MFGPIREQLDQRYITGQPGQPSPEWRAGARWALDQAEGDLSRGDAGTPLALGNVEAVLRWRNCWQPNEADDLVTALTQGVDKVAR